MAVSVVDPKSTNRRRSEAATEKVRTMPTGTARAAGVDWRQSLPLLRGRGVRLREVEMVDAGSLLSLMTEAQVSRFLGTPPRDRAGFETFIDWTHRKREDGSFACFAIVPRGMDVAVGFFQLRALEADFKTAEWGFALGRPYWGTGLFAEGAERLLAFAFEQLGVERLEARVMATNGRGNGALRKMGAVREMVLRQSLMQDGVAHDTCLWSILDIDWRARRRRRAAQVVRLVVPRPVH
jgi:[ribosomal protein S5]-alanine N-acetyltransferase